MPLSATVGFGIFLMGAGLGALLVHIFRTGLRDQMLKELEASLFGRLREHKTDVSFDSIPLCNVAASEAPCGRKWSTGEWIGKTITSR
jgi:hypothetical protein